MKSHLAYRVQHTSDPINGPFQGYLAPVGYGVEVSSSHPSIVDDAGFHSINWPFAMVCGCETLEMLRHWFNDAEWIMALDAAGFHIAVYYVPEDEYHRTKSGTQVAFHSLSEYLVETLSVLTLLDKS